MILLPDREAARILGFEGASATHCRHSATTVRWLSFRYRAISPLVAEHWQLKSDSKRRCRNEFTQQVCHGCTFKRTPRNAALLILLKASSIPAQKYAT